MHQSNRGRGALALCKRVLVSSFFVGCWGVSWIAQGAEPVYVLKFVEQASGVREWVSEGWQNGTLPAPGKVTIESVPQFVIEHEPVSEARFYTVTAADAVTLQRWLNSEKTKLDMPKDDPNGRDDEVVTLVSNGPVANRIDLVFMGDGYTAAERQKFFDDIRLLVSQMFDQVTFKSYLPIFNVHAVFRASRESGIGRNNLPKDTAYKLYREGETLRAIYPGDTGALRASCRLAPGCDYPIVIGNDPYYGGLGGEFAISTSSPDSGIMVLRHELGHQVGEVGEEYDGGGYFGANHSASLATLGWRHWLSGPLQAEPQVARFIDWPWKKLSTGSFTAQFESDGTSVASFINLSASGMEGDEDIQLFIDGNRIPLQSPGTADRAFHNIDGTAFARGTHTIEVKEGTGDNNNWLSSLTVHEYGAGFHADPHYVSAYPLYQESGDQDGFRPVNEGCLMRNMQRVEFCSICKENNWLKFFRKVSMIDGVTARAEGAGKRVTLAVPPLGQFRQDPLPGEEVVIRWFRDAQEVQSLAGMRSWLATGSDLTARWEVDVTYRTPEVRQDTQALLHKRVSVTLN